ncbi:MAG: beta-ketoacyl-ACP synthase II [Pseudomonadota bacterium]|mgnify:CR=1 FL=1
MKRVVITGIGLVTPLGIGARNSWQNVISNKSGISRIERFNTSYLPCKVAGEIKHGEGKFNPTDYLPMKELKKMDLFIAYGMIAAIEAIEDSGWTPTEQEDLDMTGVLIGSGIGGLPGIEETSIMLSNTPDKKVSPFFIPASLINLISGNLSIKYGFSGPNHAVVTACSTGAHAIGDAARLIQYGDANVMVAGGAEGTICNVGMAGFAAARALSTSFNDTPEKASRPWDRDRDGFVMGEGAGVVVLEELEHAKKRGAKIYGEIVGYGLTGDGYHITSPHPEGRGGFRAMQMAMKRAGLNIDQVDYINAHGTSTPMGDEIELGAVQRLFGDNAKNMAMSSTKSSIGHLLGAAGSVEAIYSLLAINDNIVPPTLNLDNPPESAIIDLVPHKAKEKKVNVALSNSFGFGGTNASLIFRRYE